jgi:hypothetical protein
MLKSVTEGRSRVLLAGVLALIAQGALSEESVRSEEPTTVATTESSARLQVEIDVRAYIEALNKRLSEALAREIEALHASRIEIAIAEVPTRG